MAGQLLTLVRQAPRSGAELMKLLGVTPAELALIAHPLWHGRQLQGEAAEGCCGRGSGSACVSCRLDRRWCPTRTEADA